MNYSQHYFESVENKKIANFLKKLHGPKCQPIVIISDGTAALVARPETGEGIDLRAIAEQLSGRHRNITFLGGDGV